MKITLPLLLLLLPCQGEEPSWPLPESTHELPTSCRRPDSVKGDAILPFVIRKIPLGDVSFYAKGGAELDTSVRFSPDGRLLAIGTFLGRIQLVDIYTGKELWSRKVAEGMVKQIDFSPDGKHIYFGEQSVDGFVYAAETATGEIVWRIRLADDLETSAPPKKDDVYGIYQLPGCYRLIALHDGDLIVLGVHSWGDYRKTESMTRLARVYRLSPKGEERWAFPADGPIPMTLIYLDCDPGGKRVAALANAKAANTPKDLPYRPGSLLALDGATGKLAGQHVFEPLRPWFSQVAFWQSVSVGPAGRTASVGLFDGRSFLFDLEPVKLRQTYTFGAPVMISGVPVSATATYTHLSPDGMAYHQTASSSVPHASAQHHVVAPPGPHPQANTINAIGPDGKVKWRYRSGHEYQGFRTSADGRWLLTCVKRENKATGREAGSMLFDTQRPGGGSSKLVYYHQVEGLTFFQADIARDGSAFAAVEIPYREPGSGRVIGTYQVHVVR